VSLSEFATLVIINRVRAKNASCSHRRLCARHSVNPGQVAQLVERSPEKAGVGGSIPSLATISSKTHDTRAALRGERHGENRLVRIGREGEALEEKARSPEKAGVGGSIPSLATISSKTHDARAALRGERHGENRLVRTGREGEGFRHALV
jgi:hypothetical protein